MKTFLWSDFQSWHLIAILGYKIKFLINTFWLNHILYFFSFLFFIRERKIILLLDLNHSIWNQVLTEKAIWKWSGKSNISLKCGYLKHWNEIAILLLASINFFKNILIQQGDVDWQIKHNEMIVFNHLTMLFKTC